MKHYRTTVSPIALLVKRQIERNNDSVRLSLHRRIRQHTKKHTIMDTSLEYESVTFVTSIVRHICRLKYLIPIEHLKLIFLVDILQITLMISPNTTVRIFKNSLNIDSMSYKRRRIYASIFTTHRISICNSTSERR